MIVHIAATCASRLAVCASRVWCAFEPQNDAACLMLGHVQSGRGMRLMAGTVAPRFHNVNRMVLVSWQVTSLIVWLYRMLSTEHSPAAAATCLSSSFSTLKQQDHTAGVVLLLQLRDAVDCISDVPFW